MDGSLLAAFLSLCLTLARCLALARWRGAPFFARSCAERAWRYIGTGSWREAIFFGTLAVAADPSYPHGYRMLGLAYLRAGDHARARGAYEQGSTIAPGEPTLLVALGDLERALERYAEAEPLYRRALELEPQNVEALWALGQSLRPQGRLDEAEAIFAQALGVAPDHGRTIAAVAGIRIDQHDHQGALRLLGEAVKRRPEDAFLRYSLAHALARTGDLRAASDEARRALELEPDNETYEKFRQRLLRSTESHS